MSNKRPAATKSLEGLCSDCSGAIRDSSGDIYGDQLCNKCKDRIRQRRKRSAQQFGEFEGSGFDQQGGSEEALWTSSKSKSEQDLASYAMRTLQCVPFRLRTTEGERFYGLVHKETARDMTDILEFENETQSLPFKCLIEFPEPDVPLVGNGPDLANLSSMVRISGVSKITSSLGPYEQLPLDVLESLNLDFRLCPQVLPAVADLFLVP